MSMSSSISSTVVMPTLSNLSTKLVDSVVLRKSDMLLMLCDKIQGSNGAVEGYR
ncbi:putative Conserved oligomeric Golgi complex component [Corchorus olitorius]|uniref:Conserved oligomeric Golgi complex component n=1 Tax=Corchorus olitorius TaxID=93759 RepID=A0A1R3K357_9ROSI|nr:putative Conserved oligomeric Golgi complex component [Corchorus olitorius]